VLLLHQHQNQIQVSAFSASRTNLYHINRPSLSHSHSLSLPTRPLPFEQHPYPSHYLTNTNTNTSLNMVEMSMSFQVMAHAYSNSLAEHPFVTKGTTSFLLCGVRDIIAQVRGYDNDVCLDLLDVDVDVSDSEQASLSQSDSSMPMSIAPVQIEDKEKDPMMDKIDIERLARFATKGFFGSSIWSVWYDLSESLFNSANIMSALAHIGILLDADSTITFMNNKSIAIVNIVRTLGLMIVEQFVACPIIYGLWYCSERRSSFQNTL
jgi:hypothetical protein